MLSDCALGGNPRYRLMGMMDQHDTALQGKRGLTVQRNGEVLVG